MDAALRSETAASRQAEPNRRRNGQFYDKIGLSFPIGNIRCHALKFSYEQLERPFPSHSHSSNSWEIHYIPRGRGTVTLDHRPYSVGPGSFFINGPHMEHSQAPDRDAPMTEYCVYLKFDPKNRALQQKENPDFLNRFLAIEQFIGMDRQDLHPLMKALFLELKNKNTGYLALLESLLTQLLVLSVRNLNLPENTEPAAESSVADRSYLIIEEYFLYEYQDLTLEKLASRLGLSTRQTERLLQKHYKKTFLQKKNEAKMSAALLLLQDISNSITDISVMLGYSSVEHFSAAFRRCYGMSAREWRRQHS